MKTIDNARLSILALGGVLAIVVLPLASIGAKADLSASRPSDLASLASERFQLPDPMSVEYLRMNRKRPRDAAYQTDVPGDSRSGFKQPQKRETN